MERKRRKGKIVDEEKQKDELVVTDEVTAKKSKLSSDTDEHCIDLTIEHWCDTPMVFKRRATELAEALRKHFKEVNLTLNPEKPRRGSFEITLKLKDGSDVLVWSGLKKGPPRKLKFPDSDVIAKEINKQL